MISECRSYFELCKPRVVMLMILTSLVGMFLAPDYLLTMKKVILANLGIACVASAAAAINHIIDQHIDRLMSRTKNRPLAQGKVSTQNSLFFATVLGLAGVAILLIFVNTLTALLTFLTLLGYAFFYTVCLKHTTPQNIVIGGLAGAMPPLLGWVAITGSLAAEPLLLVLIIFVWTPPHFWALAVHRVDDYAKASIPMLPNTHGVAYTKLQILLYTLLLSSVTLLPYAIHMSGLVYLFGSTVLNGIFIYYAYKLYRNNNYALKTFWYSIYYLGLLFVVFLIDHYMQGGLR